MVTAYILLNLDLVIEYLKITTIYNITVYTLN